jgi:hypothetical protein
MMNKVQKSSDSERRECLSHTPMHSLTQKWADHSFGPSTDQTITVTAINPWRQRWGYVTAYTAYLLSDLWQLSLQYEKLVCIFSPQIHKISCMLVQISRKVLNLSPELILFLIPPFLPSMKEIYIKTDKTKHQILNISLHILIKK